MHEQLSTAFKKPTGEPFSLDVGLRISSTCETHFEQITPSRRIFSLLLQIVCLYAIPNRMRIMNQMMMNLTMKMAILRRLLLLIFRFFSRSGCKILLAKHVFKLSRNTLTARSYKIVFLCNNIRFNMLFAFAPLHLFTFMYVFHFNYLQLARKLSYLKSFPSTPRHEATESIPVDGQYWDR